MRFMFFNRRAWTSCWVIAFIFAGADSALCQQLTLRLGLQDSLGTCDIMEAGLNLRSPEGSTREMALTGLEVVLEVQENGFDRAQVMGAGCWSPEVELAMPSRISEVAVPVLSVARLEGMIRKPYNTRLPEVRGRLFLRSDYAFESFDRKGEPVNCTIEDERFSCEVPIGPVYDLRLESPGFAPALIREVRSKHLTAGSEGFSVELNEGGKIVGWVESGDEIELQGAEIALYPREERRWSEEIRWSRILWARSGKSGFFEIDGVAPGEYDLESTFHGLSAARVRGVAVSAGETTRLPMPISHPPVSSVQISLTPPLDPDGQRWRVSLQDDQPGQSSEETASGHASIAGLWIAEGLMAQAYWLSVSSLEGEGFLGQRVDLSEGGHFELNFQLEYIAVDGVVRLGSDPIDASLVFRNESAQSVKAEADEHGRFYATFPAPGKWNVTARLRGERSISLIRAENVELVDREGAQEIEIVLPAGMIRGRVVDAEGEGIPAGVYLRGEKGRIAHQATSPEGSFQLMGIPKGMFTIRAEAAGRRMSPQHSIQLTEGETLDVELRVEDGTEIEGRVLSPEGKPMSGVSVQVSFDGGPIVSLVSSLDGIFRVLAPPGSTEAWVLVLTYSYPVAVRRFRLPLSQPLTVSLLPVGSVLHVRGDPMPRLVLMGRTIPRSMLFYPPPFGERDGGVFLEPGPVLVCPRLGGPEECREALLPPAGEMMVDLTQTSD